MAKKKKVAKPKAAAKKAPAKKVKSLGYLGDVAIASINEKVVGNKKFNNVILIDGVGYLLSDKDLKAQVKAKAEVVKPTKAKARPE